MPKTLNITSDLFWIGALDPSLRVFDIIMETKYGTTYNSYLLKGTEGTAIFETVKVKFFDEYLEKIKSLIDPETINYIVVNHTEPDHAGSVAKLLEYAPHATVVGSALAIKYVGNIINAPFKSQVVKEGDTLSLGNKTIRFLSVPLLHWPDTMYSYIEEDHILITCDSFGSHYCDERIFKSQLGPENEDDFISSYKYYFDCIMGPFKPYVQKALIKLKDLEIDYICPGHGMILDHTNMQKYIDLYDTWSTPKNDNPSIVIAYVSAYGYTKELAETIYESIQSGNYSGTTYLCNLEEESLESVLEKINNAEGLLLGSPTILAEALPPVWNVLSSLNPIVHKSLHASCFGSYGWSGEAVPHMHERLKQLKCTIPVEPLSVVFKPTDEDLTKAREFANHFVDSLLK